MMQKKIHIYFLTKNQLFIEGLQHLLADSPLDVGGKIQMPVEISSPAPEIPDGSVILTDYPGAFDDARVDLVTLRDRLPRARLAILTSLDDQASFVECVKAGVDGYLLNKISGEVLVESLRLIALGEKVFPSVVAAWLLNEWQNPPTPATPVDNVPVDLSKREIEILECLAEGLSNKAIARVLEIADATVKVHVKHVLRKLEVENRTQAAIWALTSGILRDRRFVSEAGSIGSSEHASDRGVLSASGQELVHVD